jgi:hypothetical protein
MQINRLPLLFLIVFCLVQLPTAPRVSAAEMAPNCAELVKGTCLACHHETRICRKVKQSKGKGSWKRTIKSMIRHGAAVDKDLREGLITCLSTPDKEIQKLCRQ